MTESRLDAIEFLAGPPNRLERWLGLIKPNDTRTGLRVFLAIMIGWVPLAVLAALRDLTHGEHSLHSLLLDFGSYARYVVVVPLCLIAESFCSPSFERIILHFRNSGLVSAAERERYEAIIASSSRLLESTVVEVITFVIAYGAAAAFIFHAPVSSLLEWQWIAGDGQTLSAAGRWHALVSLPLLIVLLLGWVWRHILWTRFLWLLSRLDLQTIPAHPDHSCGLKFLSTSIRGYGPLGFACSSIVAGGIANKILFQGASLENYYHIMLIVVVAVVLLFVAPLAIFVPVLRRAQIRAMFEYGALAENIGGQFERKWISKEQHTDPGDLEVPDFSATTDLYSIVSNVYSVGYLPLSLKTLEEILVIVAFPFVPVILTAVPLSKIFKSLANLLI
jgi:hypothetical protein